MFKFQAVALGALLLLPGVLAYGIQQNNDAAVSRRDLGAQTLRNLVAGTVVANTLTSSRAAVAVGDEVDVYFGVGCFWHIQHEVRVCSDDSFLPGLFSTEKSL